MRTIKAIFKIMLVALVAATLPVAAFAQTDPTPAINDIYGKNGGQGDGRVTVLGILNTYGTSDQPKWMEATIRAQDNSWTQTVYNPANKNGTIVKGTVYQLPTVTVPKTGKYVVNVGVGGCFGWKTVYGQSQTIDVNVKSAPQPPPPAQPTYTVQTINANRWTNTNTTVYNDWNPNTRKIVKTINIGVMVYVSTKYIINNGESLAKISDGYVNANDLSTAPTYITQSVNADRWTNTNTPVYNDWNPNTRTTVKTITTGTKVSVSIKYTLSNGEVLAKIPDGYVNANNLNTAAPNSGNYSSGNNGNNQSSKYLKYSNNLNPISQLGGNASINVPNNGGLWYVAETVGTSWENKYFLFLPKELATDLYLSMYAPTKDSYGAALLQEAVGAVISIPYSVALSLLQVCVSNLDKSEQKKFYDAVTTVRNSNGFVCIKVDKGNRSYSQQSSPFNLGQPYKAGHFFDMSQLTGDDISSLLNKGDVPRISSNALYRYNEITTSSNTATPISQQPQIYNTSNYTRIGNATQNNANGHNFIGMINSTSGFRFTVNSSNAKTATFSIAYRSDNRGGKLIVNGITQNISFTSTNWNWGTKDVQVQLRQGANTIEFYGGYQTDWAPDVAEITIK